MPRTVIFAGFFLCWLHISPSETVPVRIRERHSGRIIRSISETPSPALTVDVELPGEQLQLNLDRNMDQDTNIPVYTLQSDSSNQPQLRKAQIQEKDIILYQDPENGALFGIVQDKNDNGTVSVSMTGVVRDGNKIYDFSVKLPEGEGAEMDAANSKRKRRRRSEDLILDFNMRVFQDRAEQGAIDEVLYPKDRDFFKSPQPINQRYKRAVTQDVNIDVVALVDYSGFILWYGRSNQTTDAGKRQEALNNIYRYYSLVFNGVNMMYKSITSLPYTIHVRLSSIVVATSESGSPWSENNKKPPVSGSAYYSLDTYPALSQFAAWAANKYGTTLPAYDHLMSFSGLDLVNQAGSSILVGLAYTGTVCRTDGYASSIVEDKEGGYQSIGVAAHELGHGLSSLHDGEPNPCNASASYIMSPVSSKPSQEAYKLNPWKFSQCSPSYFHQYFTDNSVYTAFQQCMYTRAATGSEITDVTSLMPGQITKVDDQCRLMYGSSSYACRGVSDIEVCNVSNVCDFRNLWCYSNNLCYASTVAEGTTCADKKWCYQGQCVYNVSAPAVTDNCPLGDQPGILSWTTSTCAEAIAKDSSVCYDSRYQKSCCSSCAKVYRPVNGCEYGDKYPLCETSHCSIASNRPICCRTCQNYTVSSTTTTTTTPTTTRTTTTTPTTTRTTTTPTTTRTTTTPTTTRTTTTPTTTRTTTTPTTTRTTTTPTTTRTTTTPTTTRTTTTPTTTRTTTTPTTTRTTTTPTTTRTTTTPTTTRTTTTPTTTRTTTTPTTTRTTTTPTTTRTTTTPTTTRTTTTPTTTRTTTTPTTTRTTTISTTKKIALALNVK